MSLPVNAETSQPFRFESPESLDDVEKFVEQKRPLGSARDSLRTTFVGTPR
jgi:hypothetical protein